MQEIRSEIYPSISFVLNNHHEFATQLSTIDLKVMHPGNAEKKRFLGFVRKIFSQLTIMEEDLWICTQQRTSYVRVYFSEPEYYPFSHCCQKCAFVQFNFDLSGAIVCPGCLRKLFVFVYSDEQGNGGIGDEKIFKFKKKKNEMLKSQIRELFSSHRYKRKNVKKTLMNRTDASWGGGFILELQNQYPYKKTENTVQQKKEDQLPASLKETRDIIEDIFK